MFRCVIHNGSCVCVSLRNTQYYEKVSDPLDLTTIEKQILTGHYKTVEAFDTDMLKVFRNAEVRAPCHVYTSTHTHTHTHAHISRAAHSISSPQQMLKQIVFTTAVLLHNLHESVTEL